jgi:SPP1 family predicted phage head-tail adaptor
MRYWSLVTPKCQITYQGRTFELLSVLDPEQRKRELEILAKEQV